LEVVFVVFVVLACFITYDELDYLMIIAPPALSFVFVFAVELLELVEFDWMIVVFIFVIESTLA